MPKVRSSCFLPFLFATLLTFAPACSSDDGAGVEFDDAAASMASTTASDSGGGSEGDATSSSGSADAVGPNGTDGAGDESGADGTSDESGADGTSDESGADGGSEDAQTQENACMNADDIALFNEDLEAMWEQCAIPCLDADDPGACLEGCADDEGFSDGCSACFGDYGDCVVSLCGDECTVETVGEDACESCTESMCIPDFSECIGPAIFGGDEPGSCLGPDDAWLMDGEDNQFNQCWAECLLGGELEDCMPQCFEDADASEPCVDCVDEVGTCMQDNCLEICEAQIEGGDEADELCGQCIQTYCLAPWFECFNGMDDGPSEAGQCFNEADGAIMDEGDPVGVCWESCATEDPLDECMSDCFDDMGLSDPCADCMGEFVSCVQDECLDKCLDGGLDCDTCVTDECGEAYGQCFAPPQWADDGLGMCVGPEDAYLIGDANPQGYLCWLGCIEEGEFEACLPECFEEVGFSEPCTDCVDDFAQCMEDNCVETCQMSPENEEDDPCGQCATTTCGYSWAACFYTEEPVSDPGAGLCMGPDNAAQLEQGYFCWLGCIEEGEFETCLPECFEDAGFSDPCTDCVDDFGQCMQDNCVEACEMSPQNEEDDPCGQCATTTCAYSWSACFYMPEEPQNLGMCMGPDNAALMDDENNQLGQCWENCLMEGEVEQCVPSCFEEAGATEECSDCAGTLATCVQDSCIEICQDNIGNDDEENDPCGDCLFESCGGEFFACFYTPEEESDVGMCMGPDNAALMDEENDVVGQCWENCLMEGEVEACLPSCFDEVGATDECSDCAGEFASCIQDSCLDICQDNIGNDDEENDPCGECLGESCGGEFVACFYIPEESSDVGMCMGPDDAMAVGEDNEGFEQCWATCLIDGEVEDCLPSCFADLGVTEGCSDCVGTVGTCMQDNCFDICEAQIGNDDEENDPCGQCLIEACAYTWMACFYTPDDGGETVPDDVGICMGSEDEELWSTENNPGWACGEACLAEGEFENCMPQCFEDSGFSEPCIECVTPFAACIQDDCLEICMEPSDDGEPDIMSDSCMQCTAFDGTCAEMWAMCFASPDEEEEVVLP